MKRFGFIAIFLVAVGVAVGLYLLERSSSLPFGREDVVAVWLEPVPEGPISPIFSHTPGRRGRPIALIDSSIPSPLPGEVWQGLDCEFGGDVVVGISNGQEVRYGPCRRPESIDDLRRRMLEVLDL